MTSRSRRGRFLGFAVLFVIAVLVTASIVTRCGAERAQDLTPRPNTGSELRGAAGR